MKEMMNRVQELLACTEVPTACLQRINETLLQHYQLSYGGYLTIIPKEVEVYYVNRKAPRPYVDNNMHCCLDPKTDAEIWALQSGRFGKLYFHRKGLGGVDVCLSAAGDYALCCTLKAAVVNGEECWSPLKVRNAVLDAVCQHEGLVPDLPTRLRLMNRFNEPDAATFLTLRETPEEGHVYHLHRRSLRRRDKNATLPLRSFMDIWNRKFPMGNVQRVTLYMTAHPDENVLQVLRDHDFRYIPTEIKARYNLDRKARLYD